MNKNFSWLHLSDLHIGQKGQHLWPNFREQFHEDLRYLLHENGPIQCVIFSGDLTQTAAQSEFDELNEEISKLWKIFSEFGPVPSLFAVPGNHDLVRPNENSAQVKLLKRWTEDESVIHELLSGKKNQYLDVILHSFENYTNWYANLEVPRAFEKQGILPGDTSCVLDINGLKIGVVGLNSSFLQLEGGNYEERLLVSPRQLAAVVPGGDVTTWCAKNDINLLVTHHPSSWFQSTAQNNFLKDIYKPDRLSAGVVSLWLRTLGRKQF